MLDPASVPDDIPYFCTVPDEREHLKIAMRLDGNRIQRLELRGVSWFGFEGTGAIVDGLWQQPISFYINMLQKQGVNALRLPVSVDNVLLNPAPSISAHRDAAAARAAHSLDVLEMVVHQAAKAGILVLLDMHRLVSEIWPDPNGLWYSDIVPESAVHSAWIVLAQRFCKEWNVMGADLFNEPHRAYWGVGGLAVDWAAAAERLGETVSHH